MKTIKMILAVMGCILLIILVIACAPAAAAMTFLAASFAVFCAIIYCVVRFGLYEYVFLRVPVPYNWITTASLLVLNVICWEWVFYSWKPLDHTIVGVVVSIYALGYILYKENQLSDN